MKRFCSSGLILLLALSLSSCGYNAMVSKQEGVDGAWSQVENVYQRRADLIPNLVNTVKGAADFEQQTLQGVIDARSRATSIQLSADDLTEENLQKFEQAQQQLSGALSRLLAVAESYPDLKANQNFRDLQVQLEGTENRISVERRRFNEVVQDYNTFIRQFPRNITAGLFDFDRKAYFQATPGAEQPPTVDFGN